MILSISLSGQLCHFLVTTSWPHGLLPISFLAVWKCVSNERYQLLRIIFLKGEADVYTKSGANWTAKWDAGHLLEWGKSMLALASMACKHWDMTWRDTFLQQSLHCRRFNWPIVWWSCHWRDRSSSIGSHLFSFGVGVVLERFACSWPYDLTLSTIVRDLMMWRPWWMQDDGRFL